MAGVTALYTVRVNISPAEGPPATFSGVMLTGKGRSSRSAVADTIIPMRGGVPVALAGVIGVCNVSV